MSSSKKDPSAPGNEKPPRADGESDSSGYNGAFSSANFFFPNSECHSFILLHCRRESRDVEEFLRFADHCFFWINTACVWFTIYNTVQIRHHTRDIMDSISEY